MNFSRYLNRGSDLTYVISMGRAFQRLGALIWHAQSLWRFLERTWVLPLELRQHIWAVMGYKEGPKPDRALILKPLLKDRLPMKWVSLFGTSFQSELNWTMRLYIQEAAVTTSLEIYVCVTFSRSVTDRNYLIFGDTLKIPHISLQPEMIRSIWPIFHWVLIDRILWWMSLTQKQTSAAVVHRAAVVKAQRGSMASHKSTHNLLSDPLTVKNTVVAHNKSCGSTVCVYVCVCVCMCLCVSVVPIAVGQRDQRT